MHLKSYEEVVGILNNDLNICDTTLLNAEQAAGVVLSDIEKYRIAVLLDAAGVPELCVGMPMSGHEEKTSIRHIARMGLHASVMTNNRAETSDIDNSLDCDVDAVTITMPTSKILVENLLQTNTQWVLEKMVETVSYAKEHGLYVNCNMMDAPRGDLGFLINYAMYARDAGADRITYQDSVGVANPFVIRDHLKTLRQIVNIPIGVAGANDFGLAVANTLAGIDTGATFACGSILGIGARAGMAPTEELAIIAKNLLGYETGIDMIKLKHVAESVSKYTGRDISASKPVFGRSVFAQEAVTSEELANILEPYDPAQVGTGREIVLGKHTSKYSVQGVMSAMNVGISDEEAEELAEAVKKASLSFHRSLTPDELLTLYEDMSSGYDVFDEKVEESVPQVAQQTEPDNE